jgi:hypothetical protein
VNRIRKFLSMEWPSAKPAFDRQIADALLLTAECSLQSYLASSEENDLRVLEFTRDKYDTLERLYSALREFRFDHASPRFPFRRLPTYRDLFWDDPVTDLQKKCLEDANELASYLSTHSTPVS